MTWGLQETRRDDDGKTYLEMRFEGDPGIVTKVSPIGALVDPLLWERVMLRRERVKGERQGSKRVYGRQPFDGLVYCLRCGHKMYGRNDAAGSREAHRGTVSWRYYCISGRPGVKVKEGYESLCTTSHSMPASRIIAALRAAGTSEGVSLRMKVAEPDDVTIEMKATERKIRDIKARLETAQDLAIDGLLPKDKLKAAQIRHDKELTEQLDKQIALAASVGSTTEDQVQQMMTGLQVIADQLGSDLLPVDHKIAALRRIGIERILVDNPVVEVKFLGR